MFRKIRQPSAYENLTWLTWCRVVRLPERFGRLVPAELQLWKGVLWAELEALQDLTRRP